VPEKSTLILIPGLLCDEALWRYQAERLSDVSDCIITKEHMRHGSIEAIAAAVVKRAPERFAVAGLSMGGYVALEICLMAGERVEKAAFLDTSARTDTPEQTRRRHELIGLARRGKLSEVVDALFPIFLHADRQDDRELKRRVADMAHRVGADVFERQQHAIMARRSLLPLLLHISCPSIIVCGDGDLLTPPECAREIAEGIPGARLTMIKDCGHLSTMERPEAVVRVMREWLKIR
jgi:pimeloyl-ACP methyl ester carboxylesterase